MLHRHFRVESTHSASNPRASVCAARRFHVVRTRATGSTALSDSCSSRDAERADMAIVHRHRFGLVAVYLGVLVGTNRSSTETPFRSDSNSWSNGTNAVVNIWAV